MFLDICNTLFLYGILSSWCGVPPVDPVDPIVHPDQGSVLNSYCNGTTLVEEIADGQGGSTTLMYLESEQCGYVAPPDEGTVLDEYCDDPHTLITVVADGEGGSITNETPNSEQCGYEPPPAFGTLLREGCSKDYPGVKWFQYADGEGGTYSEKDSQSVECGWEPPTLVLELEKAEGDRFKPAVINVIYTDFLGREEPWGMVHAYTTLGHIERDGNNILVYGTGQTGEGILTLGREQILFNIVEEPRCGKEDGIDCQGYSFRGPPDGYIYYGDDDDQIVEWELAYFIYSKEDLDLSATHDSHITELFEKGSPEWNKVQKTVDIYNEAYERSGIHIRYVLKEGNVGRMHYHGKAIKNAISRLAKADVGIGKGSACPDTCGCAHVDTYFQENSNITPTGRSRCGPYVDLHEIGHAVGLAHGPENSAYANSGYIWPEFGHGWAALCNRSFPDIMSYDSGERGHHNSRLTCGEMYGDLIRGSNPESWVAWDNPGGYRDYADAAYHLNRIRYDVSLINCEDNKCADSAKAYFPAEQDYFIEGVGKPLELIEDYIYDFDDGPEELERERQQLQWFDDRRQLE